jgi:hypothetical protein
MGTGKAMKNRRKLASAIAGAVMAYIRAEEEARVKEAEKTSGRAVSLWGVGARQDAMQLRKLFQLRLVRR